MKTLYTHICSSLANPAKFIGRERVSFISLKGNYWQIMRQTTSEEVVYPTLKQRGSIRLCLYPCNLTLYYALCIMCYNNVVYMHATIAKGSTI